MSLYMVDPSGKWYDTQGLSHPDWCQENRDIVGFVGTKDGDGNVDVEEDDAIFDDEGHIALDYFLYEKGWMRATDRGLEIAGLEGVDLSILKAVCRDIADCDRGHSIWIDHGDGHVTIPVSFTGRPDFSELDTVWKKYNKRSKRYKK